VDDRLVVLLNLDVTPVSELTRSRHFVLNRAITFMFSNLAAYIANILWVFEPGRHTRSKEITLFYLVSGLSFFLGAMVGWALIKSLGTSTTGAYVANMVCSVMINYVCRKFYIFKR
jgi:putative flippase GtrA